MRVLRLTLVLLCAAGAFASLGCRRDFATEADRLRAQVVELEQSIEQMERENAELRAQVRALEQRPEEVSEEVLRATPSVTSIAIGRFSHVRDRSGDGVPETAVVYVSPSDGEGRFVQLVGRLSVQIVLLRADEEPIVLCAVELSPGELRAAYRASFAGRHYTVETPLNWPGALASEGGDRPATVTVLAAYTDGYSGQRYEAEGQANVRWP